ncbi:MAG TPA: response regulator [Syntrophales bacterium]|nr:response regulator [Syntrophales bacterium]
MRSTSLRSFRNRGESLSENKQDILLVEDNRYNVEFILEAFEMHNLTDNVKIFQDGAKALDYLFATGEYSDRDPCKKPRLILLDLRLPKVGGLELLRRIKSNEMTRMIPVVVFTSSAKDQDRRESYELGANSYIVKPHSHENFVKSVAEIVSYWALQNVPYC